MSLVFSRMDSLTTSTGITLNKLSAIQSFSNPLSYAKKSRTFSFINRRPRKFSVLAAKDDSRLDEWDQMELKFGRMIGEDPKITLAKIMGRKSNPDMSYLEIEKLLEKKGKTSNDQIQEIPFDLSDGKNRTNSTEGLNLVRPVPKKGVKFETDEKPVEPNGKNSVAPIMKPTKESKSSVPNVILRKPSSFNDDEGKNGKPSRFGMKPNLSLTMGKEPRKDRFSDITLLKKPEPASIGPDDGGANEHSDSGNGKDGIVDEIADNATLLQKPDLNLSKEREEESSKERNESSLDQFSETIKTEFILSKGPAKELQGNISPVAKKNSSDAPSRNAPDKSVDNTLIKKPKRLDLSSKAAEQRIQDVVIPKNPAGLGNPLELENFLTTSPIKEHENGDWARAEKLVKTGERDEVELISSSTRGFVVSFGSLIGFLPYRNLAARWKFLAFESWLRRKGLDPSNYRQNLGIIGKYDANMTDLSESGPDTEIDGKPEGTLSSDMKLEDLLMIYDQEKLKFLSSFVGQKIKVGVLLADRNSRRLIVSIKPKEKEELVEKKRSLMAKLSVGDVVKCCIKKITYFGIFVEVDGVNALIHQTEVSWDATLDPTSYFKVGQIVEAKVHQLDFSLERIFLSLKEITPDPLIEALEAVVGDNDSLGGGLEVAEADTEWPDVESLLKELEQFDGIQSVSKGRYFLSPGLAPTFQVYMASMFENQYKLLARAGNRVQEVIVQTSLGKEDLKSAILTCTNRVE